MSEAARKAQASFEKATGSLDSNDLIDALGLHDYENIAATYTEQSIGQLRLISAAIRGGIGVDELEPIVEDLLRRGLVVERIISRMKPEPEPESGAQPVAAAAGH